MKIIVALALAFAACGTSRHAPPDAPAALPDCAPPPPDCPTCPVPCAIVPVLDAR